ncbi:MAG: M24 family metallopeptidase [Bacillota bacterium]|jgi:Xaa-Pro aminopeptidase
MSNIQKLSKEVKRRGLDAMMIHTNSRPNRRYLCGFSSSGGVLIVHKTGSAWLMIDGRYTEVAGRYAASHGYRMIGIAHDSEYNMQINSLCRDAGIKTLGFEDDITSVAMYSSLKKALTPELKPAGGIVESWRQIKSRQEADAILAAQRIAEAAFEDILSFIRPGVTERQVANELTFAMYRRGADNLSFPVFSLSGPNSSMPHGVTGDRVIKAGDFLMLDFGVVKNGYYSDMTRTLAVGHATDDMWEVYETVLQAQRLGIAAARAGATCHDIDAAARDYIESTKYKGQFLHLLGHGLGLSVAEAPYLEVGAHIPLNQGAVVTIEPGIYIPGKMGVRIEDMLYVGCDAVENLTHAPKELLVL